MLWKNGDIVKVKVFKDPWVPRPVIFRPIMLSFDDDLRVSQLLVMDGSWDLEVISHLFFLLMFSCFCPFQWDMPMVRTHLFSILMTMDNTLCVLVINWLCLVMKVQPVLKCNLYVNGGTHYGGYTFLKS